MMAGRIRGTSISAMARDDRGVALRPHGHSELALTVGLFAWIVLGRSTTVWAVAFHGGSGEPSDPYQIATAEQLISINSDRDLLSRSYLLMADIDLDPGLHGGRVFDQAVIAPPSQIKFYGSFDGAGHAIRNLVVASGDRYCGLFGRVGEGGIVKNLATDNASVTGRYLVGGLVGANEGTVCSCRSNGTAVAQEGFVGGVAGYNTGTITLACSTGVVEACGESTTAGGLVGYNYCGTISLCYSTSHVAGSRQVGGLLGSNMELGLILGCYSTGSVTGSELVGGLVGNNAGMICMSYSTGTVAGGFEWRVGGLVGYNQPTDQGSRGLEGTTVVFDRIIGGYYLGPYDGGGPDNGLGIPMTAEQMGQQASFAGFDFWGSRTDGLNDHWFMPADSPPIMVWQKDLTGLEPIPHVKGLTPEEARGVLEATGLAIAAEIASDYDRTILQDRILGTYPAMYAAPGGTVELIVSKGPYDWSANPGDGTAGRPFEISTITHLESLIDHPQLYGMHFVLTADIDLTGRTYSKALIAPDVNDAQDGFQGTTFTGSLDGKGFRIVNLGIASLTHDYLGLFGFIAHGAMVTGLNLVNVRVDGGMESYSVGTVAGHNAGTITDCTATGAVSGRKMFIGELAGGNSGAIQDCHVMVAVRGLSIR